VYTYLQWPRYITDESYLVVACYFNRKSSDISKQIIVSIINPTKVKRQHTHTHTARYTTDCVNTHNSSEDDWKRLRHGRLPGFAAPLADVCTRAWHPSALGGCDDWNGRSIPIAP